MTKNVQFSENFILQCKKKLLSVKADLLNRSSELAENFVQLDKGRGDEIDQSSAHQEEHSFLINQSRIKNQLFEIEQALARIEKNSFGLCEETLEPIEEPRLIAIPWTRLSIEGAEIREYAQKKYAR